jgi:predicted permease
VSDGLWKREFGGSTSTDGATLTLEGTLFQVVGVVDPVFSGVDVGVATDVYVPICAFPNAYPGLERLDSRSYWFLRVFGRRDQALTAEQAGARLAALSPRVFGATVPQHWDAERQAGYRGYTFGVRAAQNGVSQLRGQYREALFVLMAVVGVVLLIACGNVANLLVVRATRREHEVAIRRAIGSGRGRLVQFFVTESMVLSFLGAIVAVVFARWASAFMVSMLSTGGSVSLDLGLDVRVLGFTISVATATGILFGLAPALRATGIAPQAALRAAGRKVAGRQGRLTVGKMLVVGQLAMSLSLVVGAVLLIGTLARLHAVDTGFESDGVLLVTINTRNAGYSSEESRRVNQGLLERMRALPGVRSASASVTTPIGGRAWSSHVEVDGYSPSDRRETHVWINSTSDDFFATLGTPLRAGRDFDTRDVQGSSLVAVINETMAYKFFSGSQPLGRRFRLEPHDGIAKTYEVIGVVADTKYLSIDERMSAIVYFPLSQELETSAAFNLRYQLRTDGSPTVLAPAVVNMIADEHPRISIRFTTLEDRIAASLTRPRILAVLSGFFGAVALLLAMIGLFGTISYRVTNRRNEIGVRLALGAAWIRVLSMVLGEFGRLVLAGIVLGVVGALASTRLLSAFLFGVTATDLKTLVLSAVVLASVAVAAGALPAWRAARLDPMEVLREE